MLCLAFLTTPGALGQTGTSTTITAVLSAKPDVQPLEVSVSVLSSERPDRVRRLPEGAREGDLRFAAIETEPPMDLAWDSDKRCIYMDLNGNGDLSDDPDGIARNNEANSYWQNFSEVLTTRTVGNLRVPYRYTFDLMGRRWLSVSVVAGWEGTIRLAGREWTVRLADDGNGRVGPDDEDRMRMSPAATKEYALWTDLSPAPRALFVDGKRFALNYDLVASEDGTAAVRIRATETPAPLGYLRIAGAFVQRLTLSTDEGDAAILLPAEDTIALPAASYTHCAVGVFNPRVAARSPGQMGRNFWTEFDTDLRIDQATTTTFRVGGPLYNRAKVSPMSSALLITSEIVGQSGHEYEISEVRAPATFAAMQDGRTITTGTLEYG